MSSDLEADRLVAEALRTSDPRMLFSAFLVLTRNATARDLQPLVAKMADFADRDPFLFHVLTGSFSPGPAPRVRAIIFPGRW